MQCCFCQSQSCFYPRCWAELRLFTQIYCAYVLENSSGQTTRTNMLKWVVSDGLFGQHSIDVALHPHSCKELHVCPLKVTHNLPSGHHSWVSTVITEMDRKRHTELAPHLIFTTQWTCGESMILITAWMYSSEGIRKTTGPIHSTTSKKHSLFVFLVCNFLFYHWKKVVTVPLVWENKIAEH